MKKRILVIALVVALVATCFAGSLAYLKDFEAAVNTFTTGKVEITLTEPEWNPDQDGSLKVFPGQTYDKDPTITVDKYSEEAWVAAKVIVSADKVGELDLYALIGIKGTELIDINQVAEGGLLEKTSTAANNWNGLALVHETDDCVIYQVPGDNTWTLYIFMKDSQVATTTTVLFETLTIPARWDNAEMAVINTLEIKVKAFAAQKVGFDDCFTAMTTAFADEFDF